MSDKDILSQAIDENELTAICGGDSSPGTNPGGKHCFEDYYVTDCTDTVERGSHCSSGDWCEKRSSVYQHKDYYWCDKTLP